MSIKGGSTTCPTVLGSPRSHTACGRFAPLILPNWRASSRRAGSAVTEQPAALLLRSSNPDLDAAAAATVPTGPPHGRYQQGATQRSAVPWCPTCATHALPANSTSEHLLRPSRPCWRWMASKNRPRIAVGGLRGSKVVSGYPRKSGAATPSTPCSRSTALLQAAPITPSNSPIIPPSALTATAHLKPLAQPTASRHPMFRCDIDSHPDLSRHKPPPAVVATAYSASPPHDADSATTGVRYGADSSSSCCAPPVVFPSALRCCA